MKILLVGDNSEIAIGSHFFKAAKQLQYDIQLLSMQEGYRGPILFRKLLWLWDKRPYRLRSYSQKVVAVAKSDKPDLLLTTGIAPLNSYALQTIKGMGIRIANFLTDDPFNPAHRNRWFLKSLPIYDIIFSPRKANEADLRAIGCKTIHYLPFAYQPDLHFVEMASDREQSDLMCDIFFAGGGDSDRREIFERLVEEGFSVHLYGHYWNSKLLAPCYKGYADPSKLRKLAQAAKVSLTLVRRQNRDGHSMRSFELAAKGGCMLLEDTAEHRELFKDIQNVIPFFHSPDDLVQKVRVLLGNPALRNQIRKAVLEWAKQNPHTYSDRLLEILNVCGFSQGALPRASNF